MITNLLKFKYLFLFFFIFFFKSQILLSNKRPDLLFHGGYAFETNSNQKSTAVYISIFNNSEKDVVIKSINCDIAEKVEVHEVKIIDDVVKMQMIENFVVKKNSELYLQPGGKHIMLIGLKRKMSDGDNFSLTFLLENNKVLNSKVMVLSNELRENLIN